MKITRYYSANILSLLASIRIFINIFYLLISLSPLYCLLYAMIDIERIIYFIFSYLIVFFVLFLLVEILLNMFLKDKYLIKYEIKKGKDIYILFFYVGLIYSILYFINIIHILIATHFSPFQI